MDLAVVTALSNLGGLGLLSAVLFLLLMRQMAMHDRHMGVMVAKLGDIGQRIGRVENRLDVIEETLGSPHRMRVFPADEPDPAA